MAIEDLPGCVQPQLDSEGDIEYFVNEYLVRKGYFEDLERLRGDNQFLKKELQTSDREIHKLRKSVRTVDVCIFLTHPKQVWYTIGRDCLYASAVCRN